MNDLLTGSSFSLHSKPKKLIVMLHGYGDNADNFLYLAELIDKSEWGAKYLSLNAPESIPNYSLGRQWFDLYPNGKYIFDVDSNEIKIIFQEIKSTAIKIESTIKYHLKLLNLKFKDCIVIGFSQGGMMAFELGNYSKVPLGALVIFSGIIIEKNLINNNSLKNTPIFISHGNKDDVLDIKNFYNSIDYLKRNNYNFESYELKGDTHTISIKAINLLQKFIKKNL